MKYSCVIPGSNFFAFPSTVGPKQGFLLYVYSNTQIHPIELFLVLKNMLEVLSGAKTVPPCPTLFCWKVPGGMKLYHHFSQNFPSIYMKIELKLFTPMYVCIGKLNKIRKIQKPRMNIKPFMKHFVLVCLQRA